MRKKILALALALLLILLAACGGSASAGGSMMSTEASAPEMSMPEAENMADASGGVSGTEAVTPSGGNVSADKIIYSADAGIETKEYDKTLEDVYALIEKYGGFLESSSVGGTSYYDRGGRRADFTIRVPSESFSEITGTLSELGNVTYCRSYSENVTTTYIDTEARLESYRIQEERLLAMLEKAEKLEDMLTIEAHLADVRYNIETYTTQLQYLDSQISYSTLNLSVEEVVTYTPDESVTQSFGSRMKAAFTGSIDGLVDMVQSLILFLLRSWYVIAILAVIIVVAVRAIRRRRRELEEKRNRSE
ncbi:MAG: DUF4349 domain-containing protein [Candidatus Heteroscillospira sp.]|jgi:hypothetical protein